MKRFLTLASSFSSAVLVAAEVSLPVCTVEEIADFGARRYPGRVVPVAEVRIVPQVTGEILEVAFANGADVKKGDLLYRLDSVKYEAAVKNAEAKVVELKASLAYAEKSAERHSDLVKSRAVSQDAYDNALSQRDAARAALAAAEAELVSARDDLVHCRIVSPITGRVGTTAFTEGNYVQKGGEALVTIIQMSPIRVAFSMANVDYHDRFGSSRERIVRDGCVTLRLMSGETDSMTGRVEYVENSSDAFTDTTDAYALFENADGALASGQTVMATLVSARGTRRAAVPPNAVVQDSQGAFVWTLDADGMPSKRYVVRGSVAEGRQIILSGVKAGERIVSDGTHKVKAGVRVR